MKIETLGALALALAVGGCQAPAETAAPSPEESVFVLVRHAEKADQTAESPLTEEGGARARRLASLLRDAGIETIYSSDYVRTRETAAPLADRLGLEVEIYDPDRLEELAGTLLSSPGRYFVVGHSDTTPELTRLLGGESGTPISEDEYDRLYVLSHRPGAGTTTVLLRLGP